MSEIPTAVSIASAFLIGATSVVEAQELKKPVNQVSTQLVGCQSNYLLDLPHRSFTNLINLDRVSYPSLYWEFDGARIDTARGRVSHVEDVFDAYPQTSFVPGDAVLTMDHRADVAGFTVASNCITRPGPNEYWVAWALLNRQHFSRAILVSPNEAGPENSASFRMVVDLTRANGRPVPEDTRLRPGDIQEAFLFLTLFNMKTGQKNGKHVIYFKPEN